MTNGIPALTAALAVLAGLGAAQADDAPATPPPSRDVYLIGTLRITQPYLEVTPGTDGAVAGHLLIENRSEAPDRLIGATADRGASVSLLTAAGGPIAAVAVPPNATLELTGGADHLTLTGLGDIATDGAPVAAILHFERAGFLHVNFATDHAKIRVEKAVTVTPDKPVDLAQ